MKSALLPLLIALVGCAQTQWHHPNSSTTQTDYQRDNYQCEMQAAQAYPVNMVAQGGQTTTYGTPQTRCTAYGNQMNCSTTQPATSTQPVYYIDMNMNYRRNAIQSCMNARGYSFSR